MAPLYHAIAPVEFFGDVPAADIALRGNQLRYRMAAAGGQKIGVAALACTGRCGYAYQDGPEAVLVIRNFSVNPSGEYVDVPWNRPTPHGIALQACNVSNEFGDFAELEYHSTAIRGGVASVDVSQVWSYRGAFEQIRRVGRVLLGMNLELRAAPGSSY